MPVGVATMLLGAVGDHASPASAVRGALDVPGLVVSAVALTALTWALIEGRPARLDVGADARRLRRRGRCAGVAFVVVEQRAADPMVAVSLFRERRLLPAASSP